MHGYTLQYVIIETTRTHHNLSEYYHLVHVRNYEQTSKIKPVIAACKVREITEVSPAYVVDTDSAS